MCMSNELLERPTAIPDERMFRSPIWSTWARYKCDVTQQKVLEFADEIEKHGFTHSQLELDDMYTTKYGEMDFDPAKFPDPKAMVAELKRRGFRFTAWMHPFANCDSVAFAETAMPADLWVKNPRKLQVPAIASWWQGTVVSLGTVRLVPVHMYRPIFVRISRTGSRTSGRDQQQGARLVLAASAQLPARVRHRLLQVRRWRDDLAAAWWRH